MPIFYNEKIDYVQAYLQSDNAQDTVWYKECNTENEEENDFQKCKNYFIWKKKITPYWYEDTMKMEVNSF